MEFWGYDIDIAQHEVFNCSKYGLRHVIDKVYSEQKASGVHVQLKQVLLMEGLRKLYASQYLGANLPNNFLTHIIFVDLLTGL